VEVMDEVTYMVELLSGSNISASSYTGTNTWAGSATSLSIPSGHIAKPTIVDIRNLVKMIEGRPTQTLGEIGWRTSIR
jgi:hypothetical protein